MTDLLYSETDPINRLDAARKLEKTITAIFRKAKREAAYEAAMIASSSEIGDRVGAYRRDIDYLVRCYMEDNPHQPAPPRRSRREIESFVDLSGLGDRKGVPVFRE